MSDVYTQVLKGGMIAMEFPAGFLQEETRCDFVISSMMKRAWAVQMEVLSIVADLSLIHI